MSQKTFGSLREPFPAPDRARDQNYLNRRGTASTDAERHRLAHHEPFGRAPAPADESLTELIRQRAFMHYLDRLHYDRSGSQESDWCEAEIEILAELHIHHG
jgi:hypothetical protein